MRRANKYFKIANIIETEKLFEWEKTTGKEAKLRKPKFWLCIGENENKKIVTYGIFFYGSPQEALTHCKLNTECEDSPGCWNKMIVGTG